MTERNIEAVIAALENAVELMAKQAREDRATISALQNRVEAIERIHAERHDKVVDLLYKLSEYARLNRSSIEVTAQMTTELFNLIKGTDNERA